MEKLIFEKNYEVNSVNINMSKRLGLFGMLGFLQDAGMLHAEELGVGLEDMIRNNAFWVFTQQKLIMNRWPAWKDTVRIVTRPRAIDGLKAYRDYEIFIGDEKIGESVATFMVLNGETRKPVKPQIDTEIHKNLPESTVGFIPEKLIAPDDLKVENTIVVQNSDLDMNRHVNNTKYAQWILNTIPIKYHHNHVVKEFNINFTAEARLGDEIDILARIIEEDFTFYQGVRKSDNKKIFNASIVGEYLND